MQGADIIIISPLPALMTSPTRLLWSSPCPVQLTKSRLGEARNEAAVLRDELARVSAVASRVARAELRAGALWGGGVQPHTACWPGRVRYRTGRSHVCLGTAQPQLLLIGSLAAGSKDEGTIPVLQHLEEIKYMQVGTWSEGASSVSGLKDDS